MAYIGKSPIIGNFVKLDAITAVNGQAAYTMQNGSVNFTDYSSVNQFLVSLNGTIQAPTTSFTVSGSTLTFASNLSTGDVIDFIMVFGNSLSAGTPTDATVTTAKLAGDAVTEAKIADGAVESEHLNANIISGQTELASEPADTDEFLVSDAGTLKRIDYSLIKGSGRLLQVKRQGWSGDVTVSSDTELISTSITPASTSSKIVAFVSVMIQPDHTEYASLDLYRGTLSGGTKILDGGESIFNGTGGAGRFNYNFMYIDSPSTTSATTYTVVGVPLASGTLRFGCGASNTLFLMEVSQ